MSRWTERRDRFYGTPVPPGIKHGAAYARYTYGCECKVCRPAGWVTRSPNGHGKPATQRNREYRDRKAGQPVPASVAHGSYTAWRIYKCQCPVDVAARKQARRDRDNAWRKTARGHWHDEVRDGKEVTVIHWPPRELTEPWVCPTCDWKVMPDA